MQNTHTNSWRSKINKFMVGAFLSILFFRKAGLPKEERDEIDASVHPEVIAAAVAASASAAAAAPAPAAAQATPPTAPTATNSTITTDSEASRMVDVGRLLSLCGIPSILSDGEGAEFQEGEVRGGEDGRGGRNGGKRGQPARGPAERGGAGEKGESCRERSRRVGAGRGRGVARASLTPEAAAVAEAAADENALRRVTHQADLYGRLSVRARGGRGRARWLFNRAVFFSSSRKAGCCCVYVCISVRARVCSEFEMVLGVRVCERHCKKS